MTITREHLELAALAAGHTIGWGEETPCQPHVAYIWNADGKTSRWWRPHLDDGDTGRLCTKLQMDVQWGRDWVAAARGLIDRICRHDGTETEKLRAWREAVTLCAAAVGERMRKGGA